MDIIPKSISIFLDGIGNVSIGVSLRAKYIRIIIRNNCEILIIKPIFLNLDDAINFIYAKVDWVKKHRKRISKQKVPSLDLSSSGLEKFWDETKQ